MHTPIDNEQRPGTESRPSSVRAAAARTLVAAFCFSLLWAGLCNFLIEVCQVGGVGPVVADTLQENLPAFLLGSLMVWVVLILFIGLSGRLWLSCAILMTVSVLLGLANAQKLSLRMEPLYPSDLAFVSEPGFLFQMAGAKTLVLMVFLGAAIFVGVHLLGRILGSHFVPVRRETMPTLWLTLAVIRPLVIVLTLLLLVYSTHFNSPGNKVRRVYEAAGAEWAFWYQTLNYTRNGFVGGLLYNTGVEAMARPADYGSTKMAEVADRYRRLAALQSEDGARSGSPHANVVMILSEAFSDPTRLDGVSFSEDPIPYTRSLAQRTTSGNMLAQLFGGGTANMEFEALTGMSLSQFEPQMNTPYQMLVPKYDQFPSAVGYLKSAGYEAVAIHPYMTSMYQREKVYPILGFDRFIHEETMASTERLEDGFFVSDAAAFTEVQREVDQQDDPVFINLVTMQNHYPMRDIYSDPIPVSGISGKEGAQASGYARGLKYTDEALRELLESLEASDEETIVVFYGDHLPAFWPESVRAQNGDRRMRETPFFIWSTQDDATAVQVPTTSPIHFMPMVLSVMGADIPPYYALLEALWNEIPAMELGMYINADDDRIPFDDLSERAKAVLADYRLVQYDLSVGERYVQDEMFYPIDD